MPYPVNFATLAGGNEPAALLDLQFQQVAAMIDIPSSVSGTNALSITPLVNCPVLGGYSEFCAARFRAVATSGAAVTAQFNGLGFLPVYHNDGTTQAGLGDVVIGFEYVVRFSQSLNGGGGGWFLEAPGAPVVTQPYFAPGGRLTFQSATPVMTSNNLTPQTVFYAPYVHPFVPVYNGSTIQMYQFTSSQADQVGLTLAMAGDASWPTNTMFDVFVFLNAGVLTLGTLAWTNVTTRATGLAIFGGFLTNAGVANLKINTTTTVFVGTNQATFLGSFLTNGNGQSLWRYGAAASGGTSAKFYLCNYYNKVSVNTIVSDNGAGYTYTTATARAARASVENAIYYVQSDSERTANFSYVAQDTGAVVNAFLFTGLGVLSTAFNTVQTFASYGTAISASQTATYSLTSTGYTSVFAVEQGDGTHANTFNASSANQIFGTMWL